MAALLPFHGLLLFVPNAGRLVGWKEGLVLLTLLAALSAPPSARRQTPVAVPPWAVPLGMLLALAGLSLFVSDLREWPTGAKVMFFYALLALVQWRCPLDRRERDRLVTILMVTGVIAAAVGIIMVFEMAMILASPSAKLDAYQAAAPLAADFSNVKVLGRQLYTTYLLPFEVAAVVLLLAMVAAIGLTMRSRKDTKAIDPALQVKVKRNDRVRLVKMQAEQPAEESTVEEASEAESGKQQA